MKILYFNIQNGECVKAGNPLPAYRAFISLGKVQAIECCYNAANLYNRGSKWFISSVTEEQEDWQRIHPHLLKSLKKLALKEYLLHPFTHTNYKQTNPRFPFVIIWNRKVSR